MRLCTYYVAKVTYMHYDKCSFPIHLEYTKIVIICEHIAIPKAVRFSVSTCTMTSNGSGLLTINIG